MPEMTEDLKRSTFPGSELVRAIQLAEADFLNLRYRIDALEARLKRLESPETFGGIKRPDGLGKYVPIIYDPRTTDPEISGVEFAYCKPCDSYHAVPKSKEHHAALSCFAPYQENSDDGFPPVATVPLQAWRCPTCKAEYPAKYFDYCPLCRNLGREEQEGK